LNKWLVYFIFTVYSELKLISEGQHNKSQQRHFSAASLWCIELPTGHTQLATEQNIIYQVRNTTLATKWLPDMNMNTHY